MFNHDFLTFSGYFKRTKNSQNSINQWLSGRSERIWTSDSYVPKVRFQLILDKWSSETTVYLCFRVSLTVSPNQLKMCVNYVSVVASICPFWCWKRSFDCPNYSAVSFSFSFSILSINAPLVSLGSSFLLVSLHPLKERKVKSKRLILIGLFDLHFWKL